MNKNEFFDVVSYIKSLYGDKFHNMTVQSMEAWFDCLKNYDKEIVSKVIKTHALINKFPPTISEIIEGCKIDLSEKIVEQAEIGIVFSNIKSSYPNGYADQKAPELFHAFVDIFEHDKRIYIANRVLAKVKDFVSRCEREDVEKLITLSECLDFLFEEICDEEKINKWG